MRKREHDVLVLIIANPIITAWCLGEWFRGRAAQAAATCFVHDEFFLFRLTRFFGRGWRRLCLQPAELFQHFGTQRGDVRNQALFKCGNLRTNGRIANVHQEPVDTQHPHQRIVVKFARQTPIGVELVHLEHRTKLFCFGAAARAADTARFTQFIRAHVRRLRFVPQKIYRAERVQNPTRPDFGLAACERRWAFARERGRELMRQRFVFIVQMFRAYVVNDADDGIVRRAHGFGDGFGFLFHGILAWLVKALHSYA